MTDAILQGNTVLLETPVTDQDGVELPLSGIVSATYRVSRSVRSTSVLISKSLGSGITQSSNVLSTQIDNTDTQSLHGLYHHELKIVDGFGNHSTIFSNALSITNTLIE